MSDEDDFFFGHFAALNEHLAEVRPIFDAFCEQHGFEYVNRRALGRYPRVRIQRVGATTVWFDLWMGFDRDGKRFELFRRDLPYDLGAGAFVLIQNGSRHGAWCSKRFACFVGKPFDQVAAVFAERDGEAPAHA